jgi:hypothetical protein
MVCSQVVNIDGCSMIRTVKSRIIAYEQLGRVKPFDPIWTDLRNCRNTADWMTMLCGATPEGVHDVLVPLLDVYT